MHHSIYCIHTVFPPFFPNRKSCPKEMDAVPVLEGWLERFLLETMQGSSFAIRGSSDRGLDLKIFSEGQGDAPWKEFERCYFFDMVNLNYRYIVLCLYKSKESVYFK